MNENVIHIKKFSFYISLSLTILTLVTFSVAISTPPYSGPFCNIGCFEYPFHDIVGRYPRDYYWMFPAIVLFLIFPVMMVCIHFFASEEKKIYSFIGVVFSVMSSGILVTNYFLQLSVVQISLLKNETDGISLLSQFNPHGIFIALEELGFILMSLSMALTIPVFYKKDQIQNSIRWTYIINIVLCLLMMIVFFFIFGIEREYYFEVAVISSTWLSLIVSGVFLSRLFFKEMKKVNPY